MRYNSACQTIILKANNYFAIANSPLIIILIISIIPSVFPNASAVQGNPAPPNASPCVNPCFYDLNINGTDYTIKYVAAGPIANSNSDAIVLNEIRLDAATKSLLLNVTVAEAEPPARGNDSALTLWLPRSLIDASNSTSKDAPFVAFDNGESLEYYIGPTFFVIGQIEERTDVAELGDNPKEVRALSIGLEPGSHNIQIIGTTIAPEFAFPFASIIAAALALVFTALRFTHISRFPPQ
jgi:hypothetical protein